MIVCVSVILALVCLDHISVVEVILWIILYIVVEYLL